MQKSHNKWSDRSRVGIFLCHSPHHSNSVPLVLNTRSGNVSPQFHCIYDDDFATCKRDADSNSQWQIKAKLQSSPTLNENFDISISPTTNHPSPSILPPTVPFFPSFTTPWETPLDDFSEAENNISEPSDPSLDS